RHHMMIRTALLSGLACAARRTAAGLAVVPLICAPTALASEAALPPAHATPASGASSSDAPSVAARSTGTPSSGLPDDPADGASDRDSDASSDDAEFLVLSIDSVTPQTVDAAPRTDAGAVTVGGTVRNVGDRTVSDIDVRLQRAPRI